MRSLLEPVGLDPVILNNRPDELSRGMQRRLAIALALAKDPAALVLEDVARDLDPQQARFVVHACRLLSSRGLTIVMGFPALSDAEFQLFDRVVVVGRRGLLWSGSPHEAVAWFERQSGTRVPLARTAIDFLHEASGESAAGTAFLDSAEYERQVAEPLRRAGEQSAAPRSRPAVSRVFRVLAAGSSPADARPTRVPAGALPRGCRGLGCRGILHRLSRLVVALAGRAGNAVKSQREEKVFRQQRDAGVRPGVALAARLPVQACLVLLQAMLLWFGTSGWKVLVVLLSSMAHAGMPQWRGLGDLFLVAGLRVILLFANLVAAAVQGLLVSVILATHSEIGRTRNQIRWLVAILLGAAALWTSWWTVDAIDPGISPGLLAIPAVALVGFVTAVRMSRK